MFNHGFLLVAENADENGAGQAISATMPSARGRSRTLCGALTHALLSARCRCAVSTDAGKGSADRLIEGNSLAGETLDDDGCQATLFHAADSRCAGSL
jgi:hypothetical protein